MSNVFGLPMWTLRDRHFSDRWSRETKTLGTRLGLWAHPFWRASPSDSRCRSSSYTHNRGKISLGHLCNVTNYLCFTTEVWKSAAILLKTCCCSPPRPIQRWKSGEIAGSTLYGGWGVGDEVRQVKLYSCLACAQKRQKCKFVPRHLFMIAVFSMQHACIRKDSVRMNKYRIISYYVLWLCI